MNKVRIFVSYAHKDEHWVREGSDRSKKVLISWLAKWFENEGVDFWSDHGIRGGDLWEARICEEIDRSQIALLLLSDDFAVSDFIGNMELPRIRARYENKRLKVIPILVAALCEKAKQKLQWVLKFQVMPDDQHPLADVERDDSAWLKIRGLILDEIAIQIAQVKALQDEGNRSAKDDGIERPASGVGGSDRLRYDKQRPGAELGDATEVPRQATATASVRETELAQRAVEFRLSERVLVLQSFSQTAAEGFYTVRVEGSAQTQLNSLRELGLTGPALLQRIAELAKMETPEWLLLAGLYAEAAALCNERAKRELSCETLRMALIANLAEAASEEKTAAPEVRAAMCLSVLSHSPQIWQSVGVSVAEMKTILEMGFCAVIELARCQKMTYSDHDLTGGLSVADFVEAEGECAKVLAELGGVSIESGQGPVRLAYGYMFARHYGERWNLEKQGLSVLGPHATAFFSPLFGYAFLKRRLEYRRIIEHPPTWISPHNQLFNEAARIVIDSALGLLEERFHVACVPDDLILCRKAVGQLDGYRSQMSTGQQAALRKCVKKMVEELPGAQLSLAQAKQLTDTYETAKALLPESDRSVLDADFYVSVCVQRARHAAVSEDWLGVLASLEKAEEHHYVLSTQELEWLFRGWYRRFMQNCPGALDQMKQIVLRLESSVPASVQLAQIKNMLWDAELIGGVGVGVSLPVGSAGAGNGKEGAQGSVTVPDYETAAAHYDATDTLETRTALKSSVRLQALALMRSKGPDEVGRYVVEVQRRFSKLKGLDSLPYELMQSWQNTFPPEQLLLMVEKCGMTRAKAVKIHVREPGHTLSAEELASMNAASERESIQQRLEAYEKSRQSEEVP